MKSIYIAFWILLMPLAYLILLVLLLSHKKASHVIDKAIDWVY